MIYKKLDCILSEQNKIQPFLCTSLLLFLNALGICNYLLYIYIYKRTSFINITARLGVMAAIHILTQIGNFYISRVILMFSIHCQRLLRHVFYSKLIIINLISCSQLPTFLPVWAYVIYAVSKM